MKGKRIAGILAIALFGSLIGVLAFSLMVKPKTIVVQNEPAAPTHYTSLLSANVAGPDFRIAAEKSVDAVVHVTTKSFIKRYGYRSISDFLFNNPIEQEIPQTGSGSGVIITPDGYIVTNNHVIEGSDEIQVGLNDGRVLDAELIGRDPETDVAVVKIKSRDLPYLNFGNSEELFLGDWVLAVGNPWNIGTTVTAGIVSAKGRSIGIIGSQNEDPRMQRTQRSNTAIESFIQTDAVVNRGNSGGALVNLKGELIGINTAIASPTGAYSGYSFAIPATIAKKVVDDIVEFGKVKRAAMGVTIVTVNAAEAEKRELKVTQGSLINDLVKEGAAEKAGLKIGDVVVEIDGRKIVTNADLTEKIGSYGPGDQVAVVVNRNGDLKEFKVTLDEMDPARKTVGSAEFWAYLGADLEKLSEADMKKYRIEGGVKVVKLHDGKLKDAGVPEGYIMTSINRYPVYDVNDVKELIDRVNQGVFIEGYLPNGRYEYFTFRK